MPLPPTSEKAAVEPFDFDEQHQLTVYLENLESNITTSSDHQLLLHELSRIRLLKTRLSQLTKAQIAKDISNVGAYIAKKSPDIFRFVFVESLKAVAAGIIKQLI